MHRVSQMIGVFILVLFVAAAAPVTRSGSTLLLNGAPFRFSGANIYWLGLDENVPPGAIAYPTKFRQDDALNTSVGMAARVIRSHTLGTSCGNPLSFEPKLAVFNNTAMLAADYAVYRAEMLGLKLIIPLTDNYHYFHGGKHCYTDWHNVSESEFYTNPVVIQSFKDYIRALLVHTNPYTGRQYCDTDAVLAWETGNELFPTSPTWTADICEFIKSVDSKHLTLSGTFGVAANELPSSFIDIHSDHFYPPDAVRALEDVVECENSEKVFVAGEIGWNYTGADSDVDLLATLLSQKAAAGGLYWSLFPHLDTQGFVQHGDSFTIHYRGDDPWMAENVKNLSQFAVSMVASVDSKAPKVWIAPMPVGVPVLHNVTTDASKNAVRISWRGAALAESYYLFGGPVDNPRELLILTKLLDGESPIWIQVPTTNCTCFLLIPVAGGAQGVPSNVQCEPTAQERSTGTS